MGKRRISVECINKNPMVLGSLFIGYSLLNGTVMVLTFINAEKLKWMFLIVVGFIFFLNLLVQALIFKKREMDYMRSMFGNDEEGYQECLRIANLSPRKERKVRQKKNKWDIGI